MKKLFLFVVVALLVSCNKDFEYYALPIDEKDVEEIMTRTVESDSTSLGELVCLERTDEMERLKSCYEQMQISTRAEVIQPSEPDVTLSSNMYAIRELPITIKVRSVASGSTSSYMYFNCAGAGKEVTLNSSNTAATSKFYLKILPLSSGIPYLIYSKYSNTPLCVGYYTNKPDDKILMAAADNSGSLYSAGWDLVQSSTYKSYYSIQSESYLGQSDPNNMWSIFYYVLEAKANNKLGYAQKVNNKSQQEFQITPDVEFELVSLEYDLNSPSVSRSTFTKTMTAKNLSAQEKSMNVTFNLNEIETSYFNKTSWDINFSFSNATRKFPRPTVTSGHVISPEENAKEDANFMGTSTQNLNREISYPLPIRCPGNSIAKVTVAFVKYNVTVKYTAKARYADENTNDIRECILKGTWTGTLIEDPNEVTPQANVIYTPISDGDIIL